MTRRQTLSMLIWVLFSAPQAVAWFSVSPNSSSVTTTIVLPRRATLSLLGGVRPLDATTSNNDNVNTSDEVWRPDSTNPCWQNLLDDDCSMSTMYASSFIAGKWIKSMPCGEGIEDCDMPSALMMPETYPESGVVGVDVMDFLHLKRAASINKS